MPLPRTSPPRARRWLLAWALLTALASTLHLLFWDHAPFAAGPGASEWLRRLFNALFTPSTPFSLVGQIGLDIWGDRPPWHAVLLHGLTWAAALAALRLLLALRAHLLSHPTPAAPTTPLDAAAPPPDQPSLSRRRVLLDASLGLLGAGAGGTGLAGTCVTPWALRTARYSFPVRNLPAHLDGLRIVQLSDTHLGPRIPADYIRRAVQDALDLRPDLFLLTGDYVHNGPAHIPLAAELFQPLMDSGRPVLAVLGNHDWYADGFLMARLLRQRGARMLDNDRLYLRDKDRLAHDDDGCSLCLAGLGDLKTASVDPVGALAHVRPDTPRLLLSHNPDTAELEALAPFRVDLMISGHYHGGQVKLPLLGTLPFIRSPFGQKYFGGLVQGPSFPVLISRGIGMSIVPVRIGVPPELVELTLTRAESSPA